MSEKAAVRTREEWVDDVKVIACILVVLGHFFQSMTKANILPENDLYQWFNTTIYYFHVPLFFICSGYLYQKYSKVNSVSNWCNNVAKKALALGVPYATFTTAIWVLKKVFSSSVNDPIGGFGDILLLHPSAPYWYLYTLFFIFLVTPTFSSVKAAVVGLIVALAAKLLISTGAGLRRIDSSFKRNLVCARYEHLCVDIKVKGKKLQGMLSGLLFMPLSIIVYAIDIHSGVVSFVMGLLACVAVILMVAGSEKSFAEE
ncbi:MAG: acyltransferase family protein [Blautia marasmi]